MRSMFRGVLLVAMLAASPISAAFAQPPYPPLPPPRYERVPPPPGAQYVWEQGHWHWNGRAYVWISGRYVIRQASYHRYVPGYWAARGGTWIWIPARWN